MFEGNEILSIDSFDLFACYQDLRNTKSEQRNAVRQGIISNDGCTENCIKLRIDAKSASNARDNAIANIYGDNFIIPLDLEMLNKIVQYPVTNQH